MGMDFPGCTRLMTFSSTPFSGLHPEELWGSTDAGVLRSAKFARMMNCNCRRASPRPLVLTVFTITLQPSALLISVFSSTCTVRPLIWHWFFTIELPFTTRFSCSVALRRLCKSPGLLVLASSVSVRSWRSLAGGTFAELRVSHPGLCGIPKTAHSEKMRRSEFIPIATKPRSYPKKSVLRASVASLLVQQEVGYIANILKSVPIAT